MESFGFGEFLCWFVLPVLPLIGALIWYYVDKKKSSK